MVTPAKFTLRLDWDTRGKSPNEGYRPPGPSIKYLLAFTVSSVARMTQCQPLLMMILAGVVGLAVGSKRVVRSHISQGQPYYGIEHRRYLARRALLRRQGLEEKDEGEEIETGEADQKYEQAVVSNPLQFGFEIGDGKESRSYSPHSGCEIRHETVTVVKQVPSFTKHCQKVEDTKCKTIYKNAFTTQIETQCMATFDTSCDDTLETAYKQQCKTIVDVECRIVNLESKDGLHESKKICEDVPTEKCIPVPVKVEGQKCVNVSKLSLSVFVTKKMLPGADTDVRECSSDCGARGSAAAVLQEAKEGLPNVGGDEAQGGDSPDPAGSLWPRDTSQAEIQLPGTGLSILKFPNKPGSILPPTVTS